MSYKAPKIKVTEDNPYREDSLNREKDVTNLSLLLRNLSSPITFSINAPWGEGKTTFLEMLDVDLRKNGCQVIQFSAWETDFAEDPLLAFLGEINSALKIILNGDIEKNVLLKNTMKVGGKILKRTIPVGAKLLTSGLLDIDKALEGEAEKLTENFASDLINKYSQDKSHIEEFKIQIEKVVSKTLDKDKNLFILIDELDRCRPTYAIELLERIKHLFDVERIVFVLAMDREQLSQSVKSVYGNKFNSYGYLRRFLDIEYELPKPELYLFIGKLIKNFGLNELFKIRSNFSQNHAKDSEHFQIILNIFANEQKLSLREIEQFIAKIKLITLTVTEHEKLHIYLVVFLLILKESHPEVYIEYIGENSSTPEKALDIFNNMIPEKIKQDNSGVCLLLEATLVKSKYMETSVSDKFFQTYRSELSALNDDDDRYGNRFVFLETIVDVNKSRRYNVDLKNLVSKIELSDSFKLS